MKRVKAALIQTPAWGLAEYPLAVLSGCLESAGVDRQVHDLNARFKHDWAAEDERVFWGDECNQHWLDRKFVAGFVKRHESRIDGWIDGLVRDGVNVAAFSVSSGAWAFTDELARRIKEGGTGIYVVYGGPNCFRAERGTEMIRNPHVDAVCTGEGEEAFPELLKELARNERPKGPIKGFLLRDGRGETNDGGDPSPVDLDRTPLADYSLYDFDRFTDDPRFSSSLSRGCVFKCVFCSEVNNFSRFRRRSPAVVLREIEKNLRHVRIGIPYVHLCDSLTNGNFKGLMEFCDLILEKDLNFAWGGLMALKKEMTPEALGKMRRAGCNLISWGLESGSDRMLEIMKKNYSTDVAERVIRDAWEAGIPQTGNIIVGHPGETEEDVERTCRFLERNAKYFTLIGLPMMMVMKNSPVGDNPDAFGIVASDAFKWVSKDGLNTYEKRVEWRERYRRIVGERANDVGLFEENGVGAERPNKKAADEEAAGRRRKAVGRFWPGWLRRGGSKTGEEASPLAPALILDMKKNPATGAPPERLAARAREAYERGDWMEATRFWFGAAARIPHLIDANAPVLPGREIDAHYVDALARFSDGVDWGLVEVESCVAEAVDFSVFVPKLQLQHGWLGPEAFKLTEGYSWTGRRFGFSLRRRRTERTTLHMELFLSPDYLNCAGDRTTVTVRCNGRETEPLDLVYPRGWESWIRDIPLPLEAGDGPEVRIEVEAGKFYVPSGQFPRRLGLCFRSAALT